jgi:capsular exopolysaccharide synthesis family protein
LWEILWQRKAYVALGAIAGLMLGVLYWSMAPKTYESSAQVWVLKKHPDKPISSAGAAGAAAGESASSAAEDFLGTHQSVLRSGVILNEAMTRGQLSERETFRASNQPTRVLARALTVGRDRDKTLVGGPTSQVLNVSFRCGYAEDCVPVLTAVLDSYRDYLDSRSQNTAQKTLDLIVKARDLLQNDLEAKEKARDEFLLNTPVLWKTQYGTTLHQERLGSIDAQRAMLEVRRAQLKATLAVAEAALKQGRGRAELLEIVSPMPAQTPVARAKREPRSLTQQRMSREPSVEAAEGALSGSLEQEMVHLQLEEGRLLATYGANHPQVQSLRDRLQTVRVLLAPTTTPLASTAEGRRRDTQAKERLVDLRLAQLKQEVSEVDRGLTSLEALFQSEMQEAKKVFPYETQESSLRRTISRSQLLYDNINQRLKELNVVRDTGGFDTQVITPPTESEKVSPRGSLVLPMGLLLGLLLGCGLAYLVELTDKSFRSPEDVRRRLGLPVMGVVPRIKANTLSSSRSGNGEGGWLDGSLCTWYRPGSAEAEAYRGVRTALYFSTRGQGRKIIQITSPSHSEGKSTLAANLAVCIAQSGKRVLLVDGDLRRPRVGSLFGVSPSLGVSSVLSGSAELPEAITETVIPGLSVIGSGPLPPNPSELLTSSRLRESLSWLRDHYDYVLVDSPPLLAVTDPGVVASQMDGVIVTLRSNKKGRVEAERAKEVLDTLGVPIFGIVLNAVDPSQGAAAYGYVGYERHDDNGAPNGEDRRTRTESIESTRKTEEGNGTSASGA